jgi:predicted  nucleic acid-binding Zn-ribbon protein
MGTLGKVLAICNVLAGIAFIAVAALDYGQRQAWSFLVLQQDFVLNGLPVDDGDKDAEGEPQVKYMTPLMQSKLGIQGVKTQKEEVDKRHAALQQEIQSPANEDEKRKKLEAILVPLARTLGEREDLRRQIHDTATKIDDLLMKPDGPFESAFRDALSGAGQPGTAADVGSQKRRAIAHLLIGTSQTPADYQRTILVVGATNYTRELDNQSAALRDMVPELQRTIAGDRSAFEVAHKALIQQIIALAERVRDAEENIDKQKELLQKHKGLVERRQGDVADLTKRIADARAATEAALQEQTRLEKQLFAADTKVAEEEKKNQQFEREIKSRELSSEGGKAR